LKLFSGVHKKIPAASRRAIGKLLCRATCMRWR